MVSHMNSIKYTKKKEESENRMIVKIMVSHKE